MSANPACAVAVPAQAEGRSTGRYRWGAGEVSGALGDLGTFLPHIIGAITVVGMGPAGILSTFGLFYLFSGAFYRIPMAVQPMKAASAAVLVEPMSAGAIAGAGLVIGVILLVLGWTGLITRIARSIPPAIASGLQLGLGLSLAGLGIELFSGGIWLGVGIALFMLMLMRFRLPGALIALGVGVAIGQMAGLAPPVPELSLGLHLPAIVVPSWQEIVQGTQAAVLPQIPLTLTNAIIVTAIVSRQLYGAQAARVTERNLALSQGLGNLILAPLGGYPMCHGAGGVTAHHRFGGRTATTTLIIGLVFLLLGLSLGDGAYALLRAIPDPVLGALLLISGLELAMSSKPQQYKETDLLLVLVIAVFSVAINPAVGFAAGIVLAMLVRWKWIAA